MKIDRLTTILPCSNIEELRLDRNSDESEELLSAWSALWHPALIDAAQTIPGWVPADQPPPDPTGSLMILPECCESLLPDGWLERAANSGVVLLRKIKYRPEMVQAALEGIGGGFAPIDPDLTADFLSLGFCRFVVELLTQKFRYMSHIDNTALQTAVLAAAKAAVQGDIAAARDQLQSAFDRLHESREYFYPVEVRLIDFTLAASTTLGESLRKELTAGSPGNLLISAETLQDMAWREPTTLTALKQALAKNSLSIIGGEIAEVQLPLLPPHAIESHLRRGLEVYENLLERRPVIFGRRHFGLTPALPQILAKTGFSAAVHFTLDDGQFPTGNHSCMQWEGLDGKSIDALAKIPLDANRVESFFRLPETIGSAMELAHPATMVFAHWPGRVCTWYGDLKRIAVYSRVLGAFCTLDDYFQQTALSGQKVKYNADQYRSPYLVQDVAANRADPISLWVRYYNRRAIWETIETLYTFAALTLKNPSIKNISEQTACGFAADLQKIPALIEDSLNPNAPQNAELDKLLKQTLNAALQYFSESLAGNPEKTLAFSQHTGYLLANPCSFAQRLGVDLPKLAAPPEVADPIQAADENRAVVDLPGMGFAWIGPGGQNQSSQQPASKKTWPFGKKHKTAPPMAEENSLRNEFFQATIDPHTGAIRAISDYRSRHPRLSQQVALRMPQVAEQDPASEAHYSIMSADEIRITSSGPVLGEIVSSGKISDRQGHRLAGFKQTARAWHGSRVLELEIELDIDRLPDQNPWNSYYACRFAWNDESSSLFRDVNLTTQPTELTRLESPHFVDIRSDALRTTILCGGLPCHRRIGLRKLDTLLVVQGETARRFRLGVGIDLPNAMHAAMGFLAPKTICFPAAPPPTNHGWLFHLDHRNVIASRWEPIIMSPLPTNLRSVPGEGQGEGDRVQVSGFRIQNLTGSTDLPMKDFGLEKVIGFRVHLLETEGRHAQLGLRSFRPVASAIKIETGKTSPVNLPIESDKINIVISPYEMIDVEAIFNIV
jgi:alpha-mannosidase